MKLHRVGNAPDWANIPTAKQTSWQRLAIRTHAIVTPGNIITLLGFGLVCIGVWALLTDRYVVAFILIAIGRFLDIVDGWIADKTHTKSPLGESLDAGFDKLAALVVLAAFASIGVAPLWLLAIILLPHIVIATITALAFAQKRQRLHPSRLGKLSGAVAWLGLLGLLGNAIEPDTLLHAIGYICVFAASAIGFAAAWHYGRELTKPAVPSA